MTPALARTIGVLVVLAPITLGAILLATHHITPGLVVLLLVVIAAVLASQWWTKDRRKEGWR